MLTVVIVTETSRLTRLKQRILYIMKKSRETMLEVSLYSKSILSFLRFNLWN